MSEKINEVELKIEETTIQQVRENGDKISVSESGETQMLSNTGKMMLVAGAIAIGGGLLWYMNRSSSNDASIEVEIPDISAMSM